ncbi:CobW family GTP-binding protein [Gorillibacterium timonense]|uniref:CobW family GTP-binding protein n=1 Tax=Gorillibacterium timonense TaxID=1689269 RepID=UPI00071E4FFC|nr:GTP-binding protein [Gorillibacterium timonense]
MSIPVLILSGFLGSGKTTLLLHLLEEADARGLRAGVLMNELGKRDVDGQIVSETSDIALSRLLDGCVCCTKKSELAGSLASLLRTKPDLLIIELTGVANPEEVADALTEPELLGKVKIKQIVTVLDAEHTLEYNSIFASDKELVRTLRRQIEVADQILLNKIDRVKPALLPKLEKAIRKLNDRAPLIPTRMSQMELPPLFEGIRPGESGAIPVRRPLRVSTGAVPMVMNRENPPVQKEQPASFSRIRTFLLEFPNGAGLPLPKIERYLSLWGQGLLRAKGYVPHSSKGTQLLQYAGKRAEWTPARYEEAPYLVLIGLDLDEKRLRTEWEALFPTGVSKETARS